MDVFYALAEPKRRSILEILAAQGQLSASSIAKRFHVSSAAISQHLKVLREAKLVRVEKRAQQRIYTINPAAIEDIEKWAQAMARQWNARFDELEKVLAAEAKQAKLSNKKGVGHGK